MQIESKFGEYEPTRIEKAQDWFLVKTGLRGVDALSGAESEDVN